MREIAAKALREIRHRAISLFRDGAAARAGAVSAHVFEVSAYYDRFTDAYLKATGPFMQAFRGADTDGLMRYYVERCAIADGMEILDAGSGVGAPAIWLTNHFPNLKVECLTVSTVQAQATITNAREAAIDNRLTVTVGDFHRLPQLYPQRRFDRVLFLESLGHSNDIRTVLTGVHNVLKSDGRTYINDFFQRRSTDRHIRKQIAHAVLSVNSNYCYRVMQLPDLVAACLDAGFRINSLATPAINSDFGLTVAFEHEVGRITYPTYANFPALDWYELLLEHA